MRNFPEGRVPCPPPQEPAFRVSTVERCCGWHDRGMLMAALVPAEPELFCSTWPTAAPGWGATNPWGAFAIRYLAFWFGLLPPLQKEVGRREGTPGLQISIKGLVRGLWGHLLVLFSLFTPVLILGVLIKSVINVKIFYRPIKAPKPK